MARAGVERAPFPEAARKLIEGLCNFDVDQVASGLSDDVRLSVSDAAYANGKPRVRNALIRALGLVYSIRCEPAVVWVKRDVAILEMDVACERVDRAMVSFPVTVVLRFKDELISDIRLLTYEPAVRNSLACLRTGI
jgi:SnoaL-like domain